MAYYLYLHVFYIISIWHKTKMKNLFIKNIHCISMEKKKRKEKSKWLLMIIFVLFAVILNTTCKYVNINSVISSSSESKAENTASYWLKTGWKTTFIPKIYIKYFKSKFLMHIYVAQKLCYLASISLKEILFKIFKFWTALLG